MMSVVSVVVLVLFMNVVVMVYLKGAVAVVLTLKFLSMDRLEIM